MELLTKKETGQKEQAKIISPFGYFGSKNRLASRIVDCLPPHYAWVEAFCGSAAVTLAKKAAPIEIINDIDGEIINFFTQLRENADALCREITLTPYAREEFGNSRDHAGSNATDLERARRFLVSSMMSIKGALGVDKGGFSYSQSYARNGREACVNRWVSLPERLAAVVNRLRSVRVENKDAQALLKDFANRPASLVYLDPPYLAERSKGYRMDAGDNKFHRDLLKICNRAKCMLLISGYDTYLYRKLLTTERGWRRKIINTHTRGHNGKDHPRKEILWKNRQFLKAEKRGKVPIHLTTEEKFENKLNPER